MTEIEFKALAAQGYNRIPLVAETYADLDTPLGIYLKPVSYTHLDVYKRQPATCAAPRKT